MKAEERDLILDLFERIRATPSRDNDPEAERLIRDAVARDPNSPYVLVQTVLVQEEALRRADERIRQLEASNTGSAGREPRSFLGSRTPADTLGGGSVPTTGARQRERAGREVRDERARAQASGGSFLSNALATASGVAGGMLLAESIRSLFGGGHGQGLFGGAGEAKAAEADKSATEKHGQSTDSAAEDPAQVQDAEFEQEDDYESDYGWDDPFEI